MNNLIMKLSAFILLIFSFITTQLVGQFDSVSVIRPLMLDKAVLSGVGLKRIKLKDDPEKIFHQKMLYRGDDISVFVVSTESWNNEFSNFWFDEFVYMFHGEAIVKPKMGQAQIFYSGDYFFAPKGYTGSWEIRAGENLHYELSVITTKRADSTYVSQDLSHQLFSRSRLSGAQISFDRSENQAEVLRKGVELTVSLMAEKPGSRELNEPFKEAMIQLLSGQITLIDAEGAEYDFYAGDFFVIPKGFKGGWRSSGHGIIKYLQVEKTNYK